MNFHIFSSPAFCQLPSWAAISIDSSLVIETHRLAIDLVSGALACNVASVGSPLTSYLISRIDHANGTTLVIGSGATNAC